MINKRFSRLNNNNKRIIYFVSILLLFVTIGIINVAYSKYGSNYEVKINTSSGEMIIDATIDDKEEYLENGLKYFLITVTNTKNNKTTSANIDYKITVKNQEGSTNAKFNYIDITNNKTDQSDTFQKELIIDNYSFTTNSETVTFKVYVMVDSGLTEEAKYQVTLDAVQKEMK